jgi:hypothetical protein
VNGRNLRLLKLNVQWIPDTLPNSNWSEGLNVGILDKVWNVKEHHVGRFTTDEAMSIMSASTSRIRLIGMGPDVYMVRPSLQLRPKRHPTDHMDE